MTTGEIIKKLRDEHDLTQEQLGEIVGVQKSAKRVSIRKGIVSVFLVRSPVTHF